MDRLYKVRFWNKRLLWMTILIINCQLSVVNSVQAQQDPHFTMYMFNNQYFNPAFAGTTDFITASLFYRRQWVNMPGAPLTQNLTAILPIKRKHIAIGLNVVNDKIGITGATNVNVAFAYYINLKAGRLSFGVDAGLQQYRLYGEDLNVKDDGDGAFTKDFAAKFAPNFNFGVFYKTLKYYAGISSTHLNNPGRAVTSYNAGDKASTARHYYLTAGYVIEVNEKFKLTPSFISRFSESKLFSNNFSTDVSFKLEYMEMVWFGTTYRTSDAMAFFTGFNLGKIDPDSFHENIRIGYAFDYTVSRLPGYNGGTHEIFISYEYAPLIKRAMPKFK